MRLRMPIRAASPNSLPILTASAILNVTATRIPPTHDQIPLTNLIIRIESAATFSNNPPIRINHLRSAASTNIHTQARVVQPPHETAAVSHTRLIRV